MRTRKQCPQDKIGTLYIQTHITYSTNTWLVQPQAKANPSQERGDGHKVTPLDKELFEIDGC